MPSRLSPCGGRGEWTRGVVNGDVDHAKPGQRADRLVDVLAPERAIAREGGWDLEQSVELARRVQALGVDLVDCSSGGNLPHADIPLGPGYQTPFAERIRREAGVLTGTVGMITDPAQADHVIRTGQADATFLARELLRDPYWPLRAARELGQPAAWPAPYLRAAPHGSPARTPANLPELESCFEEQHAVPESGMSAK